MEGIIIKYLEEKGFGFIETESKSEYFFHRTGFIGSHDIKLYDKVDFTPQNSKKGVRAVSIRFLARGERPKIAYIDEYPNRMMYSRDGSFPGGFAVAKQLGTVWAEAKGFRNARNLLLAEASRLGANAVIITKEWETHHSKTTTSGWLNLIGLLAKPSLGKASYALSGRGTYNYRMAHFEGKAVVVSRKKRQR